MTTPNPERIAEIAESLSEAQRACILALSDEWQQKGYSKTEADILWAMDSRLIVGGFPALVDCRVRREQGIASEYQHKLGRIGLAVRDHLKDAK